MNKVLLAEDHLLVRAGIRLVIEEMPDFEVIAEADDGHEAIELAIKSQPDIVVMDIAMPRLNGLEATERILRDCPNIKIVILSMYANEQYVRKAFQVGASAYLLKKSAVAELQLAFKAIIHGERYLSPPIASLLVNEFLNYKTSDENTSTADVLTSREREIMQLIAEGYSNQEIAEQLNLSVHTVRTHRGNLMQKLDLHNQTDVVRYAIQSGIIESPGTS